jgi:hypothetical protein
MIVNLRHIAVIVESETDAAITVRQIFAKLCRNHRGDWNMRKHTKLERSSFRVALFLLGIAFSAPLICTAQIDYPIRIRGMANLTINYSEGTLSIEFRPAAAKADAGLRPGEGSWLDRALNRNEPHVLKQKLSQDEAEFVVNYLQNPNHYATFYCTNTNQGYFQAGSSEPSVVPPSASQSPRVEGNPAPVSQLSQETDALPTFTNPAEAAAKP